MHLLEEEMLNPHGASKNYAKIIKLGASLFYEDVGGAC